MEPIAEGNAVGTRAPIGFSARAATRYRLLQLARIAQGGCVMADRRLWLVDAGYLFNAQRSVGPAYQFDYLKLRQHLETNGELWRAYYLNSTPNPPTDAQDSFHSWLRSGPPRGPKLITQLYGLKTLSADRAYCQECGAKVGVRCATEVTHHLSNQVQKGVDVGLATVALAHADQYDTLLLSSGDADLLDAIEHLSERSKRIELVVFKDGVSTELQARADVIHWIDDFAEEVRYDRARHVPAPSVPIPPN